MGHIYYVSGTPHHNIKGKNTIKIKKIGLNKWLNTAGKKYETCDYT